MVENLPSTLGWFSGFVGVFGALYARTRNVDTTQNLVSSAQVWNILLTRLVCAVYPALYDAQIRRIIATTTAYYAYDTLVCLTNRRYWMYLPHHLISGSLSVLTARGYLPLRPLAEFIYWLEVSNILLPVWELLRPRKRVRRALLPLLAFTYVPIRSFLLPVLAVPVLRPLVAPPGSPALRAYILASFAALQAMSWAYSVRVVRIWRGKGWPGAPPRWPPFLAGVARLYLAWAQVLYLVLPRLGQETEGTPIAMRLALLTLANACHALATTLVRGPAGDALANSASHARLSALGLLLGGRTLAAPLQTAVLFNAGVLAYVLVRNILVAPLEPAEATPMLAAHAYLALYPVLAAPAARLGQLLGALAAPGLMASYAIDAVLSLVPLVIS